MAQPTISGYSIANRLGSGGFASVYLATSEATGQQVAIKILHDHASKPDDLRRFERERTTMRALSGHPNIVGVFDSGLTDDGLHFTALEYVEGGSVKDRIDSGGALHWANVVEIGVQICAALDVAHRSGVLHRDVKPANILLDDDTAKLSDFGIARLIGQSQVTAAQSIIGTLAYTPPEIFHNKPFDGRGDIYQLGISLYEMLLGRAPFTSAAADNKATIIRRILDNPAPPLAQFDVPQPLSDLLDEVLAKEPADRPQSAESFGRRLNEVEAELGRTPTHIGEDTQSIAIETASITPAEEFTIATPPPTFSVAPEASDAPSAPIIEPPVDANLTVAEPHPLNTTSLIESQPNAAESDEAISDEPHFDRRRPAEEPSVKKKRWPWVAAAAITIGAAGAGVGAAQLVDNGNSNGGTTNGDLGDEPGTDRPAPQFAALDDPAFADTEGEHGMIFGSARNDFGLTVIGAIGDGEAASDQVPMAWSLGVNNLEDEEIFIRQRALDPDGGRLWSIGVIPGKAFLAVGDTEDGDGLSLFADVPSNFVESSDASFTGPATQSLRSAVRDGDSDAFLVGGSTTVGNEVVPTIWTVTSGLADAQKWGDPQWGAAVVVGEAPGLITDIASTSSLAVAVATTDDGNTAAAALLIRREGGWANLIAPIPDAEFSSVTIAGERIVAVGTLTETAQPFAIVADADGNGWLHRLPANAAGGQARAVTTLADGHVIAVGFINRDEDSHGAIWELLPIGNTASIDDEWQTVARADLEVEGFVELWAIDQFRDTVYVFGRTEDGDRRPAGVWTIDLSE